MILNWCDFSSLTLRHHQLKIRQQLAAFNFTSLKMTLAPPIILIILVILIILLLVLLLSIILYLFILHSLVSCVIIILISQFYIYIYFAYI